MTAARPSFGERGFRDKNKHKLLFICISGVIFTASACTIDHWATVKAHRLERGQKRENRRCEKHLRPRKLAVGGNIGKPFVSYKPVPVKHRDDFRHQPLTFATGGGGGALSYDLKAW